LTEQTADAAIDTACCGCVDLLCTDELGCMELDRHGAELHSSSGS
jgi:hypothetical protein